MHKSCEFTTVSIDKNDRQGRNPSKKMLFTAVLNIRVYYTKLNLETT